jgi:hypothetical protein
MTAIGQQENTTVRADSAQLEHTVAMTPADAAEERKAILDQQVAAAVGRGGGVQWWGRGSFEAVVSYHRYLPGRPWTYAFRLLALGLVLTRPAIADTALSGLGAVFTLGVIVLWAGRTRYERITVDEHGGVEAAGAGLLGAAAGLTLLAGLNSAIFGGAHLEGVIQTAMTRGYNYDFRLAALLTLGITLVFGGAVCLTAVRGLARGQRRAWDRGMIGTVLLILVALPIGPLPVQGELAAGVWLLAAVALTVLVVAWRQLEAGGPSPQEGQPVLERAE